MLLEQLQKPLSAPPRDLPRGEPFSWKSGAGLNKHGRGRVLGERRGDRTPLCSDVVGLLRALHALPLPQILDLAQVMVYE